jgi:hypothetical protein
MNPMIRESAHCARRGAAPGHKPQRAVGIILPVRFDEHRIEREPEIEATRGSDIRWSEELRA